MRVVVDGFYAKQPFLKAAAAIGPGGIRALKPDDPKPPSTAKQP